MVFNSVSCTGWSSIHPLWKNVCLVPVLKVFFFFLLLTCVSSLYILILNTYMWFANIVFCSVFCLYCFLCCAEDFWVWYLYLYICIFLPFIVWALGIALKNSLLRPILRIFHMFSSKSLMVSGLSLSFWYILR